MDCHDVRVLLALWRREGAIDPTERAALQQHLDACPECAAHSHSEQVVDTALGQAMRAVTIPAGLHERVLTRLATERPRPWPKVAAVAAAATLLLAVGTTWWALHRSTPISMEAVVEIASRQQTSPEDVERWFAEHGIEMKTPGQLDYQYIWTFDIVEFAGRRVPKLVFFKDRDEKSAAILQVLVLSASEFDMRDLPDGAIQGLSNISVDRPGAGYVYVLAANAPESKDAFMLNPH
jgi:anti-sigma factor (TIGR02949 family)